MTGPIEIALRSAPRSWGAVRFKVALERREERNTRLVYEMLSLTSAGTVVPRSSLGDRQEPDEKNLPRYLVAHVNDLIVNPMWLIGRGIGVATTAGAVSPDYRVFRPRCHHPRFLHHLLRSDPYVDQYKLYARAETTFDRRVQQDDLDNTVLPVPPFEDQRRLAELLDRETSKIDALIAKQEQLIATLREDRTATITHAVTKGLDPEVEMTETGVEWLGEVPAQWRQAQLRHIVYRIEQGVSPEAYAELADDGWGVLKAGCVNGGVFQDTQHKKLPAGFEIDPAIIVKEGDLLVCRASGSPDLVGSTAVVRQLRYHLILSDKTFRLIPSPHITPDYLAWAMNSRMYREQVRGAISGAEGLANNLPMSSLKSFRFPVPPLDEQKQIVVHLNERSSKVGALIEKAEGSCSILREYRSALITDAVTGKIDVRGAA